MKNDHVSPAKNEETKKTATQGFGNIPFHRTEYVAESITGHFSIDDHQIRGYGLSEPETEFLLCLCKYKIRKFLSSDLRLRTACDLEMTEDIDLPSVEELENQLQEFLGTQTSSLWIATYDPKKEITRKSDEKKNKKSKGK